MPISVNIPDRLYDYTDEEKAAEAVSWFQSKNKLKDEDVIALWKGSRNSSRDELEKRIFDAIDGNGSASRARNSIPSEIILLIDDESTSEV